MKVSRIETVIQFVTDQEASSRSQPLACEGSAHDGAERRQQLSVARVGE
jgi:hypothetical protein